jgi:hypothetical protein
VEPVRFRFFASGEYGERTLRPHYHAILFGLEDRPEIQDTWPHGFVRVDPLSTAAIAYVAGYCSKKIGFRDTVSERVDPLTGELYEYQPPYIVMSRRPGIGGNSRRFGKSWRRTAIANGQEIPVPRFLHAAWKAQASPDEIEALKAEKGADALLRDSSAPRLAAGEAIASSRLHIQSDKRKL